MCDTFEPAFAIGVPGLDPEEPPSRRWLALLHLLALLFGFVGPGFILAGSIGCHCGGQLTACKSNCKNIATALEMYADDNHGHYPRNLEQLTVGNYLKLIPTCPAVGRMTYTNYHVSQKPDSYRFACVGDNHARSYAHFGKPSNNCPRYNAESGLVDHP
jgi:hypothetical protein